MKFAMLTDTARQPTRKHETDAGIDLYADIQNGLDVYVSPNSSMVVHTGVTVEIPKGFFGWITNKSGNNHLIGGGIVDEGYQGELLVKIINPYTEGFVIGRNSKAIAQLLIIPCLIPDIQVVRLDEMHKQSSNRGADGGIVRQTIPHTGGTAPAMKEPLPVAVLDDKSYPYVVDDLNFDSAREDRIFGRD